MILQYFVTEEASGKTIPIEIDRATIADLATTKSCWQSDWTSDFISDPSLEKYAAKTDEGEIVALGAYKEDESGISIYIVDIEAHPESNPTLSQPKKYLGIGAFGLYFVGDGHGRKDVASSTSTADDDSQFVVHRLSLYSTAQI